MWPAARSQPAADCHRASRRRAAWTRLHFAQDNAVTPEAITCGRASAQGAISDLEADIVSHLKVAEDVDVPGAEAGSGAVRLLGNVRGPNGAVGAARQASRTSSISLTPMQALTGGGDRMRAALGTTLMRGGGKLAVTSWDFGRDSSRCKVSTELIWGRCRVVDAVTRKANLWRSGAQVRVPS